MLCEEACLVGEHRANGERKYYRPTLRSRLCPVRSGRAGSANSHQQLKEELGLDHFEGRSWSGIHSYALMSMTAYAFLQSRRLTQAGRKKESSAHPLNPACL